MLGNGLAEGFQRDGWLETQFQAAFPELHLSFRNLGFAGDDAFQAGLHLILAGLQAERRGVGQQLSRT